MLRFGQKEMVRSTQKEDFYYLFLFHWKNLDQYNSSFAKPHFGGVGWGGAGGLCKMLPFSYCCWSCSPPQAVAGLCGLVQCGTGCECVVLSPVPTRPFPVSSLRRGRSLRLWTEFLCFCSRVQLSSLALVLKHV